MSGISQFLKKFKKKENESEAATYSDTKKSDKEKNNKGQLEDINSTIVSGGITKAAMVPLSIVGGPQTDNIPPPVPPPRRSVFQPSESLSRYRELSRSNPALESYRIKRSAASLRRRSIGSSAANHLTRGFSIQKSQRNNIYIAIYDIIGSTKEDLNLIRNEHVILIEKTTKDKWLAKNLRTGDKGFVPANSISLLKGFEKEPWYFGYISRKESEMFLLLADNEHSSFLIRSSESRQNEYSLSVRDGDIVKHYRIRSGSDVSGKLIFYITDRYPFSDLLQLIRFYQNQSAGLCCKLGKPCIQKEIKESPLNSGVGGLDTWQIQKDQIELIEKIGSGNFGEVYKGVWNKTNVIAVKTLKPGTTNVDEFLSEAQVMKKLRHPKLLQLYGVCTEEEPFYIVTECMKCSLLTFLRNAEYSVSLLDQMSIGNQVASAMAYLESENFLHRDLAARNVLVADDLTCKVADFGLSRILQQENEYLAREGSKFPIKWTAPEALSFNKFTIKSDVWSYGVLLYEVFTCGAIPYADMTNHEVMDIVSRGYRLPRPYDCPKEVYSLMLNCWNKEAQYRPSFWSIQLKTDGFYTLMLITSIE